MPINEIEQQLDARGVLGNFPRLGKLRKGAEKPDGGGALKDLDYFRLTLEPQYEAIVREPFEQMFGTRPQEFQNVQLAADSPDQAFQYWFEAWAHARLLRRCDGDDIVVEYDESVPGNYSTIPHSCTCDKMKRACKQHGRLDIVIPALCEATGLWGKFTVETHSIYDIVALRSSMKVAEAALYNFPSIAFWSVPFTIGRAVRPVPVTINGKRSIKPMSLLYAQVAPDFNKKIFTPTLTAPSRLLLEGVNPETGELPDIEAEFIQDQDWDRAYVEAQTAHLFNDDPSGNHQANTLDKMIASEELLPGMTDEQAIEAISENRARRQAEKNGSESSEKGSNSSAADEQAQSDLEWQKDTKRVSAFLHKAQSKLNMDHGKVMHALRWLTDDNYIENVEGFTGTPEEAWGACVIAYCRYDLEAVREYAGDGTPVFQVCERLFVEHPDIPF
jgi:hypothetical protein